MAPRGHLDMLGKGYQSRRAQSKQPKRRPATAFGDIMFAASLVMMVSGLTAAALYNPVSDVPDAAVSLDDGDRLLSRGDLAAARASYARALAQGEVSAALQLGKTYDPAVFTDVKVNGLQPDRDLALRYYKQAAAAGFREAQLLMTQLQTPPSR